MLAAIKFGIKVGLAAAAAKTVYAYGAAAVEVLSKKLYDVLDAKVKEMQDVKLCEDDGVAEPEETC